MTRTAPFDYELAADLPDALAAVADEAMPIHGGTELLPAMGLGLLAPRRLVSLRRVEELRACEVAAGRLVVGAGLTHRCVSRSESVRAGAPLLAEVADGVGNIRVRSTGTVGGNLAFAEPRSDVTTVLLALQAQVQLASATGLREVPMDAFLLGPYEVGLEPGELIVSVSVPESGTDFAVYRKIVTSERPIVGVALVRTVDTSMWRLVVGAAGLMPVVVEAQQVADFDPAAIVATVDIMPDSGGSEEYKQHVTGVVIERARTAAQDFERSGSRT